MIEGNQTYVNRVSGIDFTSNELELYEAKYDTEKGLVIPMTCGKENGTIVAYNFVIGKDVLKQMLYDISIDKDGTFLSGD